MHSWQGMCEGGGLGAPFTVQITRPQAKIPQEVINFLRNFKEALQNATPPSLFGDQTRFQEAPSFISTISMPCAFSSSRMRSASAKFLAFLAS